MDERNPDPEPGRSETRRPEGRGSGYELLVVWGDVLETFELPHEGTVTLGRAESNRVRIDHPSVSRRHARLSLGMRLTIEDLGGHNGTFVRDSSDLPAPGQTQPLRRLMSQSAEFAVGDLLLLGAVSAMLRRRSESAFGAPNLVASGESNRTPPAPGAQAEGMREIYAQARRAARASISVLLLGETGVGKELLARAIHAGSPRAKLAFMGINCAALGEGMLEGELFGYERGAFTGAIQARPGLFEAADGGTVFLDEIGELPLLTQARLLRVLEERTVLRIGARATRAVDIRVIAATNRDLETDVQAGRFRPDLFYRLNAITLRIPPLRERAVEIPGLTQVFLASACRQLDRPLLGLSSDALQLLVRYAWPGNVRELRNAIERAVVLCEQPEIQVQHLPRSWAQQTQGRAPDARLARSLSGPTEAPPAETLLDPGQFRAQIDALERSRILAALSSCGGNQTRAAQLLGMSRRTLVNRLDQLTLPRPKKEGG